MELKVSYSRDGRAPRHDRSRPTCVGCRYSPDDYPPGSHQPTGSERRRASKHYLAVTTGVGTAIISVGFLILAITLGLARLFGRLEREIHKALLGATFEAGPARARGLRAALLDKFSPTARFSIHMMSGQLIFQAMLFFVAAALAVMLMAGIRTRLAAFASWFMLVSIQNRTPVILQGGDVYLRVFAFIAMFLPLGALYSVDSGLREPEKEKPRFAHFSTPGVALIAQVAMVYTFAVLLKTAPEWRRDFSAVYYALQIQQITYPLGQLLLHFPKLLPWLTRGTLVQECILPLFVLTPILAGPARLLAG